MLCQLRSCIIIRCHLRPSAACMHVHNLTPIKLPSILIRMLVLSIQLPSRHFASSRSTVTRDRLEISYSGLVGGFGACLGRLCSHGYGNCRSVNHQKIIFMLLCQAWALASCLDLRLLSTWWLSERKLPSGNKGPGSLFRFLYPKFVIFLSHARTPYHTRTCMC